jgi:co-chaperonin GroES (HSP10)
MTEATAAALPQPKTGATPVIQTRMIRPLGEQIIIRTIPPLSVGSIIVPDSAKGITMMGDKGASDAVHFVEAEVIAVGPGKRGKDRRVFDEMVRILEGWNAAADFDAATGFMLDLPIPVDKLLELAKRDYRIPPLVKPGDRILYHPAVQRFDREIDPESIGLPAGERCFIVSEMTSVLAVIER